MQGSDDADFRMEHARVSDSEDEEDAQVDGR